MFNNVTVIGAGRAGSAIAARLRERGVDVRDDGELRLLCVPDRAIAEVARSIEPGPWVAHVSGGTPLSALDPHIRRFSVHPLQTLVLSRGPEQLDGAWGAVTGEDDDARARARWLAETLGLRPFPLADDRRALYHAGAAIASNFLVTLYRVAVEPRRGRRARRPRRSCPLMERTIENGFELTGPIARGDWETVDRHRDGPARLRLRQARGLTTHSSRGARSRDGRAHDRRARPAAARGRRPRPDDGRAARGPLGAVPGARGPSATCSSPSLFVNPTQFSEGTDLAAYPRDPERDLALAEAEGIDVALRAGRRRRCTRPASRRGSTPPEQPTGSSRRTGRGTSAASPPICLKLFNIVRPQIAWFGRKDAQQVAVVKQLVRDLNLDVEIRVVETVRDPDGLALSSRNALLSPERARAGARNPPRARRPAIRAAPATSSPAPASSPTTSRSPTSTARPSRSPRGSARSD